MASYNNGTDNFVNFTSYNSDDAKNIFETYTLLKAIGNPRGKDVVDLCCGTGRLAFRLLEMGANSVTGVDVSSEMLSRAEARRNQLPEKLRCRVRFVEADIGSSDIDLQEHDLVTGMYVFHYADTPDALFGMGRFVRRHMKSDGACALVTLNPNLEPSDKLRAAQAETGVYIDLSDGPQSTMRANGFSCPVWRWPKKTLERELGRAGLCGMTWTPRDVPSDRPDLKARFRNSIQYPHNVVFTARPGEAEGAVRSQHARAEPVLVLS